MKKIVAAATFALVGSAAFAGGYIEPVMEAPVIVEQASGSSAGGFIVPLLILALVAAAVAKK
ncbi:MAG: hypothetical protein ACRBBK_04505 [Paracoccaceae bacterium]